MSASRKRLNFAMSCVGGALGAALLRQLRASAVFDYRLVGVDASARPAGAGAWLDAFEQVPYGDAPDYVDVVIEVLGRQAVEVFWPASDGEAVACAAAAPRFAAAGIRLLAGSERSLSLITDKAAVYGAMAGAGLRVPAYAVTETAEATLEAMRSYGYPDRTVITKPPTGRGGRGLVVFEGRDAPPAWLGSGQRELRTANRIEDPEQLAGQVAGRVMVMPTLSVPAYDVDVLAGGHEPTALVVRRRGNPTGIPFEGNMLIADADVQGYCRDIAELLQLDSLHDMDLLTGPDGVCLLEVNPRASGSMVASLAAGFPLLDAAIGRLVDVPIEVPSVTHDIQVTPYVDVVCRAL